MKKFGLFPALALTIVCLSAPTVHAKNIVTYSDDVLSFDYDSDFVAFIDFFDSGKTEGRSSLAYYYASTSMVNDDYGANLTIYINRISDFEKPWLDSFFPLESNENFEVIEVLNKDDDCREIYCESKNFDEPPEYRKLLSHNDDTFIVATFTISDDEDCNEFIKTIYDSLDTSNGYNLNGYSFSDERLFIDIYGKYIFSDQSLNYIRKSVDVVNQYLKLEIDSEDAYEQLEEIDGRFDEYLNNTEYRFDFMLYSKLSNLKSGLLLKDDGELITVIQEIESMCNIE